MTDFLKITPREQARLEHARRRRFWKRLFWDSVAYLIFFLALFGVMFLVSEKAMADMESTFHIPSTDFQIVEDC